MSNKGIKTAGFSSIESFIKDKLKSLGYYNFETSVQGKNIIKINADGVLSNICVNAHYSAKPFQPNEISQKEVANIVDFAKSQAREPWYAHIHLSKGVPERVDWIDINKKLLK